MGTDLFPLWIAKGGVMLSYCRKWRTVTATSKGYRHSATTETKPVVKLTPGKKVNTVTKSGDLIPVK
jgi:hypothetical protein